jgi:hypothetical protein
MLSFIIVVVTPNCSVGVVIGIVGDVYDADDVGDANDMDDVGDADDAYGMGTLAIVAHETV